MDLILIRITTLHCFVTLFSIIEIYKKLIGEQYLNNFTVEIKVNKKFLGILNNAKSIGPATLIHL